MTERNLRFLPEIPLGWRIWAGDVEVAGTHHHIDAAVAFAQGDGQTLTLEPEPTNPHDPKAIKVLGWSQSRSEPFFVGYVPKDIAEVISTEYQPRIKNIWLGGYQKPVVYIRFDVLVPKEPPESPDATTPKKRTSKPKKLKPIERPPLIELYLPTDSERPPDRMYCERCKQAHLDVVCPTCGNDHRGGTQSGCIYCHTDYRGSRQNCPNCTVERLLDKARMADDVPKSIAYWRKAYDEARAGRYSFSYRDYLPYAGYLGAAGFAEDAMTILKQIRAHLGQKLAASAASDTDQWSYFNGLGETHQAMAKALSTDPIPKTSTRKKGIVFHGVLHQLYHQCQMRYSSYGELEHPTSSPSGSYHTNRMKDILRWAKLNKAGRPEQLQAVFVRLCEQVPRVSVDAVRDDVVRLVDSWERTSG